MARMVTIEGSRVTPCDRLGRGVRARVQFTDDVRKLVKIGAVTIVDESDPAPYGPLWEAMEEQDPIPSDLPELPLEDSEWTAEPGPQLAAPEVEVSAAPVTSPKPPPRNGATVDWITWVEQNVPGVSTDGKSRDELIAMWQEFSGE